jgi:hypothetical protein
VPFDSEQRGLKLAVFDIERDEPGAIKEVALGTDDLPNQYTVHDLYEAWSWMFEIGADCVDELASSLPKHQAVSSHAL